MQVRLVRGRERERRGGIAMICLCHESESEHAAGWCAAFSHVKRKEEEREEEQEEGGGGFIRGRRSGVGPRGELIQNTRA